MAIISFMEPVSKGLLLMTNILSIIRIEKLVVPEVIASDSRVSLECVYSGAGDDVTVLWLHNGTQVYEWMEGMEPLVSGVLEGRIDLSHRGPVLHPTKRSVLHMAELTPEISGDYTCVVQSRGQEARMSKTMIIFSPEQDFELTFSRAARGPIKIKCIAKHLYPQPDLTIEYNKAVISQQQQRIWRFGSFYDAECTAELSRGVSDAELACRLRIPQVDYTAITKKHISDGKDSNGSQPVFCRQMSTSLLIMIYVLCTVTSQH